MEIQNDVFIKFWQILNEHDVRYIMVGGFAVNIHGFSRNTGDIDVWVEDTPSNRERLGLALEKLNIAPKNIIMEIQFVPGWTQMNLEGGFPLDIMTELKGLEGYSFSECLSLATWADIDNISVPFLQLNHLILAKKAANRAKDKIDIEELQKIIDIQSGKGL